MHVDITSKGSLAKFLMAWLKVKKIKDCEHLMLDRVPAGWYYVKCQKKWATAEGANNVNIDRTGYNAPSSYAWPVCPPDCRMYKKSDDFELSVTRDQYEDEENGWEEASKPEPAPLQSVQPKPAPTMPEVSTADEKIEVMRVGKAETFPSHRWKEHPVIVPIVAFIAGALGALAICFSYVLPVMTQDEHNKIEGQDTQISSLNKIINDKLAMLQAKDAQIAALTDKNGKLTTQIGTLELDKFIAKEDLYPVTFRTIRIGDSADLVNQQYDKNSIEHFPRYLSIKVNDNLISNATYYFYRHCKTPVITHIMFFLRDPQDINAVIERYKPNFEANSLRKQTYEGDTDTYFRTPPIAGVYAELRIPAKEYGPATIEIYPKGDSLTCKMADGSTVVITTHSS